MAKTTTKQSLTSKSNGHHDSLHLDASALALHQAAASPVVRGVIEQLDASLGPIQEAVTLPPQCYSDRSFYEFEKETIFFREWLCLGRVEQVPAVGDYYSITVADEPLVVVRSAPSEIRVMSAVCRHRCMVITAPGEAPASEWGKPPAETKGNVKFFQCPYHFWTYDLTGQLTAAPEMQRTPGFDKTGIRLPNLKVEIWNGFIFVNFDPDSPRLAPRLKRFSDWIANWHLEDMEAGEIKSHDGLNWNWKVMHENSIECYHCDRLHRGLHEVVPGGALIHTDYDDPDEAVIISRAKAMHADYALNPTYKALLPVIETLTDYERNNSIFGLLPPTLLLGMNTDSALFRIVLPTGPDSFDVRFGNLFPKGKYVGRRFEEIKKMATGGLLVMTSQDFPADAGVQKGLKSRFATRSRYSWEEEPLAGFNQWLIKRYRDGFERARQASALAN
jgi:phenylpropionate dioxygenase-like ring-hydroxylating dioxygenase large terminal subunit